MEMQGPDKETFNFMRLVKKRKRGEEKKKAQHPARYEPTTTVDVRQTEVLQPCQPNRFHNDKKNLLRACTRQCGKYIKNYFQIKRHFFVLACRLTKKICSVVDELPRN